MQLRKIILLLLIFLNFGCFRIQAQINDSIINILETGSEKRIDSAITFADSLLKNEISSFNSAAIKKALGKAHNYKGDIEQAFEYYFSAVYLFDSLNIPAEIFEIYLDISQLYLSQNKITEAFEYSQKVIDLSEIIGDTIFAIRGKYSMAKINVAIFKYPDAIDYLNEALTLAQLINSKTFLVEVYAFLGDIYQASRQLDKANQCYMKALQSDPSDYYLAYLNYRVGQQYYLKGKFDKALVHLEKAFSITDESNYTQLLLQIHKLLSNTYEATENWNKSLLHFKQFSRYSDSLKNELNKKEVSKLNDLYLNAKIDKEVEIKKINETNRKQSKESRVIFVLSVFIIIALLAILFLSIRLFNKKSVRLNTLLSKQKNELETLNKQKDEFFSFVAHDLKNPINNIMGFAELLTLNFKTKNYDNLSRYTTQIYNSTKTINIMVDHLLEWSRLQRGSIKFEPQPLDIASIIKDVIELYKEVAEKENIIIKMRNIRCKQVYADKRMVLFILKNLISNAIKFNKPRGHVLVISEVIHNKVQIIVQDTGGGITYEDVQNLFRIDVKRNSISQGNYGTGLELILVHDMIMKNGGEIWVQSDLGVGSKFYFTLPIPKELLEDKSQEIENLYLVLVHKHKVKQGFNPEIINFINNELMPRYNKVKRILSVEDLKSFANMVIKTGEDSNIIAFEKYGTELLNLTKALQFDKILLHLPVFYEMVNIISE